MDPAPQTKAASVRDPLLVAAFALIQGVVLHWKAFADPNRFHENWRQSPHWLAEANQSFQPDDAMVAYASFNTSPFADFFYQTLALTGQDLLWGKVNTVAFYALTAMLIFITGRAMAGRAGGLAATSIFLFFPSSLKVFAGGFMSGLSMPLLCLAVLVVYREKWWWSIPVTLLATLVYPMVAIQGGMLYAVDVLVHDRHRLRDPRFLKHKLLPLSIAAALCVGFILNKYPSGGHEYGHIVDRIEIGARPDFADGGRTNVLPVRSVFRQAMKRWGDPFHVGLMILAFLALGRRSVRLPRGLWSLIAASLILYWIADLLLLRLYFPDRYVKRSFPLVMALAGGWWFVQIRQELAGRSLPWRPGATRRIPLWPIAATALLVVGLVEFGEDALPPGNARTKVYDRVELYDALRELPGRPMVAAHPRLASELQLLTGKSMFVTRELSHPWWTEWWVVVTERTQDYFRAAHDRQGAHLRKAITKHKIDYWVVDRKQYSRTGRMRKGKRRHYMAPFDNWIGTVLKPTKQDLLRKVPQARRLYDDEDRYFIVSSIEILDWLDKRGQ
jgi:hypothetical protein